MYCFSQAQYFDKPGGTVILTTQPKGPPLVHTPTTPEEAAAIQAALTHLGDPTPEHEAALPASIARRNAWVTSKGKTLLREEEDQWLVACYNITRQDALELIAALCDALDINSLRLEAIAEAPFAQKGAAV